MSFRLEAPIIIIGTGGSGSSLLNETLNAHPDIAMKGEMQFLVPRAWSAFWKADGNTTLRNLRPHFEGDPGLEARITAMPDEFQAFLGRLEAEEFKRTGSILRQAIGAWFCVDEAAGGVWGFKEIWNGADDNHGWDCYDHVFPEATWVHIVRHPLSQIRSAARLSNLPLDEETVPLLLRTWLKIVEMSRRRASTGRYHEIRYEDFLAAPRRALSPLLDEVGAGWHDECQLALHRQWGKKSNWRPLPLDVESLIGEADDLSRMMAEYEYQRADADPDLAMPKPAGAALEPLGNAAWKISGPLLRETGECWELDLSQTIIGDRLSAIADQVGEWRRSPLRLFENDRPLGPAHALHFRIREEGGGLYSHWQHRLMFSTSDNSSPNTNGRTYSFDLEGVPG